jgi:hypothetical protein
MLYFHVLLRFFADLQEIHKKRITRNTAFLSFAPEYGFLHGFKAKPCGITDLSRFPDVFFDVRLSFPYRFLFAEEAGLLQSAESSFGSLPK